MFTRAPQLRAPFEPASPECGYYNDLRGVADGYDTPEQADGWMLLLMRRRERAWPVSLLQLGLGAWQHGQHGRAEWLPVVRDVAEWVVVDMDGRGRLAHHQPMPHTFELPVPWFSAMAQGQAVSLLVRAAATFARPEFIDEAQRAAVSLLDPALGLIAETEQGQVLQEYPTDPPAHVLNGWIWALWGLYDLAHAADHAQAAAAFEEGVATLCRRLPLYDVGRDWSRYDLYPHPVRNVASPFYHRLHVEQLHVLAELSGREELAGTAARWESALSHRLARWDAVARKVGFRMLRPRKAA